MNVYAESEGRLVRLLSHRRSDFREKCIRAGLWILRMHGPHGCRLFPLPRECRGLQEALDLTQAEIRNVTAALLEIGLLERESGGKDPAAPKHKDCPVIYRIGTSFQLLFPAAKALAEVQRRNGGTTSHSTSETDIILAPLVEATCNRVAPPALVRTKDRPFGRPVIPRIPKRLPDLFLAKAEAEREALLKDRPTLSLAALATCRGLR